MIEAILNYNYMQNAFVAAVLASLICGVMGTIIVEKKMVSMSGGIAHASFGGIGAGYYFQIEPIVGGLVFAIATALGVGYVKRKGNTNTDTIINMFWSAGMAIGIMFVSFIPGYPPDMTSYLFGDILTVNDFYIGVMFIMTIIVMGSVGFIFNYWKIYLFDEEYAKIIGIRVIVMEVLLHTLMALSIVVLIKVVGVILALAMLTIPPAISKFLTNNLKNMMVLSSVVGILFSIIGLAISYYINMPSGATIIMVGIVIYFITLGLKQISNVWQRFVNR